MVLQGGVGSLCISCLGVSQAVLLTCKGLSSPGVTMGLVGSFCCF